MKRAPRSRQRHDLYAKYHDYDSEISDLLGECGLKQLAASVSASYGFAGKDSHAYLEKFIHLTVPLTDATTRQDDSARKVYLDHLLKMIDQHHRSGVEGANEYLLAYAQHTQLSLRAIQRIYTTLALASATAGKNMLFVPGIIVGLAILKLNYPDLYRKAKAGTLVYADIEGPLGFNGMSLKGDRGYAIRHVKDMWTAATDPNAPAELKANYRPSFVRYHVELDQLVPILANRVVDQFKPPT